MQIGKSRHLKTCENFGKTMNEDSKGLGRHCKGNNSPCKSQDIFYESKHPKGRRNNRFRARNWSEAPQMCCQAPQVSAMLRKCDYTLEVHETKPCAPTKAPQVCWEQVITAFCYF